MIKYLRSLYNGIIEEFENEERITKYYDSLNEEEQERYLQVYMYD